MNLQSGSAQCDGDAGVGEAAVAVAATAVAVAGKVTEAVVVVRELGDE
jgi:hypothetical protein